jgi:hypothetical protein
LPANFNFEILTCFKITFQTLATVKILFKLFYI